MTYTTGAFTAQRHPKYTAQAQVKHLFHADDDFAFCRRCELPAANTIHAVAPGWEKREDPTAL